MSCKEMKTKLLVRFAPIPFLNNDIFKFDIDKKLLYVRHMDEFHGSQSTEKDVKYWYFETDGIFCNSGQDEVYSTVMDQIVDDISAGGDYVVLSCGQNCSGKSYTMSGFQNRYESRGLVPRFVMDLFDKLEAIKEDFESHVSINVTEIHKNSVYPLLTDPKKRCKDVESMKFVSVASEMKCLKLLFKAEKQRITMENTSYNSHVGSSIVTFIVKLDSIKKLEPLIRLIKVSFVDLAGIETINRNPLTSFKGKQFQEGENITKTLLELFAMHSKLNIEIKQLTISKNNNILTTYLDHLLSNTSSKTLICHLRPTREDLPITLSLMTLGNMFRGRPATVQEEKGELVHGKKESILTLTVNMLEGVLSKVNIKKHKPTDILSKETDCFIEHAVASFINEEIRGSEILEPVKNDNIVIKMLKKIKHTIPPPKESSTLETDSLSYLRPTISTDGYRWNNSKEFKKIKETKLPVHKKSSIKQTKSKNEKRKSKPIVKLDLGL